MTQDAPVKLPPMSALEFAIESTFRNFFFSIRLVLGWLVMLAPLLAAGYLLAFSNGMPDFAKLPPAALVVFGALAVAGLLAALSIAVNWHRRILLKQTPKGFGWIRLDGAVWRSLWACTVIALVLGMFGAGIMASLTYLPVVLEPHVGPAAKAISYGVSGLLGLLALLIWYRLSTRLPAVAVGNTDYGWRRAWRTTRANTWRLIGFTFWLVFGLAIAGAMGAGAVIGQQKLANPWATVAAFAFAGLLVWLSVFLIATVCTSHYHFFAERGDDMQ